MKCLEESNLYLIIVFLFFHEAGFCSMFIPVKGSFVFVFCSRSFILALEFSGYGFSKAEMYSEKDMRNNDLTVLLKTYDFNMIFTSFDFLMEGLVIAIQS